MTTLSSLPQSLIVGTAGHIDHGKSAMVRRMTGIDPDRLKEEKERGITIDLGFAWLTLPKSGNIGIVDVPGHEKFVRNMLAGASGIDVVILVIAADEGVMPQTREHLNICQLLGIRHGLVALTKIDMVEQDWLELVKEDTRQYLAHTFLKHAPIIPISSKTGEGFDILLEKLDALLPTITRSRPRRQFRMHIDRAFSIHGFGSIVTGTIAGGSLAIGDTTELLPEGLTAKVRNLQVHNHSVPEARTGQRCAVNLQGMERKSISRGQTLCAPGAYRSTFMLDAMMQHLEDSTWTLKTRTRVRFHLGTREVMARLIPLEQAQLPPGKKGLVQFRLEQPVVAAIQDHFVVRSYSPVITIGGGVVIDTIPEKKSRLTPAQAEQLHLLQKGHISDIISYQVLKRGMQGCNIKDLVPLYGFEHALLEETVNQLINQGTLISLDKNNRFLIHSEAFESLQRRIINEVSRFHQQHRLEMGINKEELRSKLPLLTPAVFNEVIDRLKEADTITVRDDRISLPSHRVQISSAEKEIMDQVMNLIHKSEKQAITLHEAMEAIAQTESRVRQILQLLIQQGILSFVRPNLYFMNAHLRDMARAITEHFQKCEKLTVSDMKSLFGLSRKYAIPLLEYFDQQGLTIRSGNVRLRRK